MPRHRIVTFPLAHVLALWITWPVTWPATWPVAGAAVLLLGAHLGTWGPAAFGQATADPSEANPAKSPVASATGPDPIAAMVDGRAIHVSEVRREIERALRGRPLEPAARPHLEATALTQLINRRLVLQYLAEHKLGANEAQLQLALARVEKQLQQQELTLDQYLKRGGLTREQLEETLAWQLGWRRYLDRYLTDQNLQTYFDRHRADFDGRRVRVAQILLRADNSEPGATEDSLGRALARAKDLAQEINAGKIAFADAARRHSEAPSSKDGGELGYIERHQPMPESFSAAAFALETGQLSHPVISPLGVHLIQCQEIEPGKREWTDAWEEVEAAVTRYLFEWVASAQRPKARVEFSGTTAHFQPGTEQIVRPGSASEKTPVEPAEPRTANEP
jgi:parvulin-like peptidyl-prolyl isomerase